MAVTICPSIEEVLKLASKAFIDEFKQSPTHYSYAPGRVNLIGEHIDYSDGWVLPMALPMYTVMVGVKKPAELTSTCRIATLMEASEDDKYVEFELPTEDKPLKPSPPFWSNYVKGVIANFPGALFPFDAVIATAVPVGGGLSSSAAIEVATFLFLESLHESPLCLSLKEKALCCQKAEHQFPKVPCGIMDQMVSLSGKKGHAVLIDCLTLNNSLIPLADPSVVVLITNSNVRHELSGSEYSSRRESCEQVSKILNKSLRDATLKELEEKRPLLTEEQYVRARHAITEMKRTLDASEALKEGNFSKFGSLMKESHRSLRDDYEVSCEELDQLVELASKVVGVYGSRMTGGGFGGCTVTVLNKNAVDKTVQVIKEGYMGKPTFYLCKPSDGASFKVL